MVNLADRRAHWGNELIGETQINLDAKNLDSGHQTAFSMKTLRSGWPDGDETSLQ